MIRLARWNEHYLIPRLTTGTAIDSTPVSSFVAPDWVVVTRGGANAQTWNSSLTLSTSTNYAVGRYAYAVYNEGGTLDMNAAGGPSTLTPAQLGQKGALALADLTQLAAADPTVTLTKTQIDNIIGWRNNYTAQPSGLFNNFSFNASAATNWLNNYVRTNTNGFLQVSGTTSGRTDQAFLSRQELLKFWLSSGLDQNALQYLGTFSRELNGPSWEPRYNATELGGTSGYAYRDNATTSGTVNRFLPSVRFPSSGTITSYRADGTSFTYNVNAGDCLVQRRFPLGRLSWVGPNGLQSPGTAAAVQACFGLAWNQATGVWQYVGPTGTTELKSIETLDQVAAEKTPREPNFFELLQAGILNGSIGMDAQCAPSLGGTANESAFSYYTLHEGSTTLHTFRIGASIITQTGSTNCPIVVEYTQSGGPWQACGIANLPYLNMLDCLTGQPALNSSTTNLPAYLMFGLWNPHQNPQGTTPSRPNLRLHVQGLVSLSNEYGNYTSTPPINQVEHPFGYMTPLSSLLKNSCGKHLTTDFTDFTDRKFWISVSSVKSVVNSTGC